MDLSFKSELACVEFIAGSSCCVDSCGSLLPKNPRTSECCRSWVLSYSLLQWACRLLFSSSDGKAGRELRWDCASPARLSLLPHKAWEIFNSVSLPTWPEIKGLMPVTWYLFSVVFIPVMEQGVCGWGKTPVCDGLICRITGSAAACSRTLQSFTWLLGRWCSWTNKRSRKRVTSCSDAKKTLWSKWWERDVITKALREGKAALCLDKGQQREEQLSSLSTLEI